MTKYIYVPNGTEVESDNELPPALFEKAAHTAKPKAKGAARKQTRKADEGE